MNKQELIEQYREYENALFDIGAKVSCQKFLQDLEQLDEPEKSHNSAVCSGDYRVLQETERYVI